MDPASVFAIASSVLQLVGVSSKICQLAQSLKQTGDLFPELERQTDDCRLTLGLLRETVERLSSGDAGKLHHLNLRLCEGIASTKSLVEELGIFVDGLPKRRPLESLTRRQTLHHFRDKPKRWAQELEIRNARLNTACTLLRQHTNDTIATSHGDRVPKPEYSPQRASSPFPSANPSLPVDGITGGIDTTNGNDLPAIASSPNKDFCRSLMVGACGLFRWVVLAFPYKEQEGRVKSSRIGAKESPETMDNGGLLTPRGRMLMRLGNNILTHSPLLLASVGAIIVGKWRPDPPAYQTFVAVANTGDAASMLDTLPTIEYPKLLANIAATSFFLTLYHYILVQMSKDRELPTFAFVGSGAIAGLLAGLDGISILLRIAPWCAIAAFFLCAFILPPRNRNPNIAETQDNAGEPRKEATSSTKASADLKTKAGLGTKMDTSDAQYIV